MKKIVRSSNLALRFYKSDGWTREDIEPYLVGDSTLDDTEHSHMDHKSWAYYRLTVGSNLHMKSFYNDKVLSVHRAFDDYPYMTDLEFLEHFNW